MGIAVDLLAVVLSGIVVGKAVLIRVVLLCGDDVLNAVVVLAVV